MVVHSQRAIPADAEVVATWSARGGSMSNFTMRDWPVRARNWGGAWDADYVLAELKPTDGAVYFMFEAYRQTRDIQDTSPDSRPVD
jgi:hypothetical protein